MHCKRFVSRATKALCLVSLSWLTIGSAVAATATEQFWRNAQARTPPADAPQVSVYRSLQLDLAQLRAYVANARGGGAAFELALPAPDGTFAQFLVADSGTMPAALQAKYPQIVSLAGSDAAGRKVRIDVSPSGVQAMVFDRNGAWLVQPESPGSADRYMSFRRADAGASREPFQCDVHGEVHDAVDHGLLSGPAPMTVTGAVQRDYRAAFAANHNYVTKVCAPSGAAVECGLAAVVVAVNRVNQIYETELAIHLTLIDNNDEIIYPTAAGDPYGNTTSAASQNVTNLASAIGNANFDIGHVFTTGSGGVVLGLGVTCTSNKAAGTTGMPNPVGDAFYIDYVAHEVGHQFGAAHTYNSVSSGCTSGQRSSNSAYEPGSASTIMGYASLCGANDLQQHSDPYMHARSLAQIQTWVESTGGSCAVDTPSTNVAPVIDAASLPSGYTIPVHTAFALTGAATDADAADTLTYNWEQYDLGPATNLSQGDTGRGPIFRSFDATESGTRVFPRMQSVLGEALVKGEAWPTTTRDLTFRLTVRDNHDTPGTPQFGATQSSDVLVKVVDTAGPFAVTRPNTAISWGRGETHAVTWDVANTSAAPVNCTAVDIDLSVDGGTTWPDSLASGVLNNGRADVVVPQRPDTTQARVRVGCADNIFFDVSDANFKIAATGDPDPIAATANVTPGNLAFELEVGANSTRNLDVANVGDAGTTLNYTIAESSDGCATTGDVAWLSATPTGGNVAGGSSASVVVGADATGLGAGTQSASLCVTTNDPAHASFTIPVELTVTAPDNDQIFKDGFDGAGPAVCEPTQLLGDPSFEMTGGGDTIWNGEDSGGSGPPICDADCNSPDETYLARTGDFFVWLGGWEEANTAWLSQSVVFPQDQPRWLNYWMINLIGDDPSASLTLSIDSTVVHTFPAATGETAYSVHSVEIPAGYLDGQAHTVRLDWSAQAQGGAVGEAILDDVTLDCAAAPAHLPPSPAFKIGKRVRR